MFDDESYTSEDQQVSFIPKEGDHYCTHHRKPTDIGGKNLKRNKSKVLRSRHSAWHALYGVLPASQIILSFQEDCEIYGNWNPRSPLLTKIIEGYANGSRAKIKRRQAWFFLFEDMALEEIVQEINAIWLDPDYQIQIGLERVKKVWIATTTI